MSTNLSGWQIVMVFLIGSSLAIVGAWLKADSLVPLAGTIFGGLFMMLQPSRSPDARTRSSDRSGDRRQTGTVPAPGGQP